MRRLGKTLGRLALLLIAAGAAFWFLAPREAAIRGAPFAGDLSDPAGYLATREAAISGITPGTQARIVWAGQAGATTPLSILYLHGFSATSEEIRPVPDNVATALDANLVFARLRGHGRDGAALARARAGDWIDDTAEALAVARAVGDRVLILSTSTGGTLSVIAATEPDMARDVLGLAMVSPNFALVNPAAALLEFPLARHWVPWLVGAERSFEDHATYWTTRYPSSAGVTLGTLMAEANARDYSGADLPALFLFSDADRVVSAAATRTFAQGWRGPVTLVPLDLPEDGADPLAQGWRGPVTLVPLDLPEAGADPFAHVIAGDILSPAMTERVTDEIVTWARGLQD